MPPKWIFVYIPIFDQLCLGHTGAFRCKHVRYLETIKNGKKMIKNVLNCFREAVKIVAWVVQSDTLRTTLIQEMYLISEVFDTFKNKKTTLHVIFKESLLWGALCSTVICS